jgi:hypothetical protein
MIAFQQKPANMSFSKNNEQSEKFGEIGENGDREATNHEVASSNLAGQAK